METLGEAGVEEIVLILLDGSVRCMDRSLIYVDERDGRGRGGPLFILDEYEMRVPVAVMVGGTEGEA